MYGHQAEIKRIQSRLQKIGKAHPYHNLEGSSSERRRLDESDSGLKPDSKALLSTNEPPSKQQPKAGKQYRSSLNSTGEKESVESPEKGSAAPSEEGILDLAHGLENPEESFRSTRDRYRSAAGKQALNEMGKAVGQGKRLPNAFDMRNTLGNTSVEAPRSFALHPDDELLMREPVVGPDAKENAHVVAHALRHRQTGFGTWQFQEEGSFMGGNSSPYPSYAPNDELAFAPIPRFTLIQGAIWLLGAVIVRMGIDRLLMTFPHLWPIMAAMVLTPVAISLYQTAVTPQSTVHSGRRLLVIMMGLLIGGQL